MQLNNEKPHKPYKNLKLYTFVFLLYWLGVSFTLVARSTEYKSENVIQDPLYKIRCMSFDVRLFLL